VSKYVKFTYDRAGAEIARFDQLAELNAIRRELLELRLIGLDSNGIGFGNLSVRDGASRNFYITGSATGGLPELTHAAIYESDSTISAVIHCHDSDLWATLLDRAPTTSKSVAYGTPEMAYEIMRLFKASEVRSRKILVMAGHEGGIVTFGKNLEDAFRVLMRERQTSGSSFADR
jgi:L-ribulose-5-phosphate 4-epimerase